MTGAAKRLRISSPRREINLLSRCFGERLGVGLAPWRWPCNCPDKHRLLRLHAVWPSNGRAIDPMGAGRISAMSRCVLAALLAVWFVSGEAALADEVVAFPSLDGALTGGAPTPLRGLLLRPAGPGPFPAVVA